MSPTAIDMIVMPPLEPAAASGSIGNSAPPPGPSFEEHLKRAERRPLERTNRSEADRSTTDAAAKPEQRQDQPVEKKESSEPAKAAAGEADAATKTQAQTDDRNPDDHADQEAAAEGVVAAVVAPTVVDPTEIVVLDTVEIAAETVVAIDTASQPELPVVTEPVLAIEPTATLVEAVDEIPATVVAEADATSTENDAALEAPTVDVANTIEPLPTPAADPKPTTAAGTANDDVAEPIMSPLHAVSTPVVKAATDEEQQAEGEKKQAEPVATSDDSAKTAPSDTAPAQIVAAAETAMEDRGKEDRARFKNDGQDSHRSERTSDSIRADRPHGTESTRTAGRETVGTRTQSTEGSTQLSQGDRVRLVERVARAVRTAEQRGGDLKIRLSPPELGSLRLQIKMIDGTLSARLEAETPEAQRVLVDNLPQLRERLSDQNIRVERFDVDLFNSGHGGAPQHSREEFAQAMQSAADRRNRGRAEGESAAAGPTETSGGGAGRADGRLDITV